MTPSARPPAPSKKSTLDALARMKQALDAFRVHRDDLSAKMVSVFLVIAQANGITAEQIGQKVRLSQSAVSRAIIGLGRGSRNAEGLGLIRQEIDRRDARANSMKLTVKGQALAAQLAGCIGWPAEGDSHKGEVGRKDSGESRSGFEGVHWSVWVD